MMIKFKKSELNPVLPRTPESFYSKYVANPDVLPFNDQIFYYFRGQNDDGEDQIGVAHVKAEEFDGVHWIMAPENPVIRLSRDPAAFDSGYILDPATIIIDQDVHLYYTAHRSDWNSWNIPSHVGLACSSDGVHFEKHASNPVIQGMAPEITRFQNRYFLFYQKFGSRGALNIFCCESQDGIHFDQNMEHVVFEPSDIPDAFDSHSISTVRIWKEDSMYYMFYGGCDRFLDYPSAFGLARSTDLINWERYPGNPVLERGVPGDWDEGALWFATVFKRGDRYYLWYEGTGTGLDIANQANMVISKRCREQDYGEYGASSFSQIGMATFDGKLGEW